MPTRIGLLLPRSTDYPAMGYDIIEGLRSGLGNVGIEDFQLCTENIGFGTDAALNYAKAEKLLIEDNADMLIAYANPFNAEPLYMIAEALHKPLIILDAGMQLPEVYSSHAYHISLQGVHACRLAGHMAGAGNRKVLMATSFYDGGYRGPWGYDRGLSESGGSVCGNYVSGYKLAEFTIEPYLGLLHESGAASVGACFSSYLAELFFKALNEKKSDAVPLPFYCSPYMAEEQLLNKCNFPGGDFYAVVPWATSLGNEQQASFKQAIEKNKTATIFHLLGWEAAIAVNKAINDGVDSLSGFSYESPRGLVHMHPETHCTYAPLYKGRIMGNDEGRCELQIIDLITIDADDHKRVMEDRPADMASGWKNNYLCI
jgi:branched-chain amino acid transport system substrate-binding protein